MTVNELIALTESTAVTQGFDGGRAVTSGYSCDLLSWVMTHGRADMAWVTVQTHLNVIAVATLLDFSCVIIPENIEVPQTTADKAQEEGVLILRSPKTAYELCGLMYESGLRV